MSKTINVSTPDELYAALALAKGGEKILLEGGDYGALTISPKNALTANFLSNVTIASRDPESPARVSELEIRDASHIEFNNIHFDYQFARENPIWHRPFKVINSHDISIQNSLFDGDIARGLSDVDDGYAYAIGLSVRDSANIEIISNEFHSFHRGAAIRESANLLVLNNDVHSMRSDGLTFADVQGVTIEGNYIHDFKASLDSADHRDMIQFWTTDTNQPSHGIVIRGNILDVGSGDHTQSIFMRNEAVDRDAAGEEMFYRNILIEENVIANKHLHGITVGESNGLTIRHNSILDADPQVDSQVTTPQINVAQASQNVAIERNAVAQLNGYTGQATWAVVENAFVQNSDRNASGFYEAEFVSSTIGGHPQKYIVDPNSSTVQLGAGASHLRLNTSPETLIPAFDVATSASSVDVLVFDARYTFGAAGEVTEDDASFTWNFGDGTSANGRLVQHEYAYPGRFDASLTVVTYEGTQATASANVGVAGDDIVSFDTATGYFLAEGYGATETIRGSDSASLVTNSGHSLNLGGQGAVARLDETVIARFFGADAFNLSMNLRADTFGSWGEVARVHGNFVLSVDERGALSFALTTDTETITATTAGAVVNHGANHDITITFDGASGSLLVFLDGEVAAEESVAGSVRADYPRDLVFGNPWGKENFDGKITAFDFNATSNGYPIFAGPFEDTTPKLTPAPEPSPEADSSDLLQPDPDSSDGGDSDPTPAPIPAPEDEARLDTLLAFDSASGFMTWQPQSGSVELGPTQLSEAGLRLRGQDVTTRVEHQHISKLLETKSFQIDLSFHATSDQSHGEIARIHGSLIIDFTPEGDVRARLWQEGSESYHDHILLQSSGLGLIDMQKHDVSLSKIGHILTLSVDGMVADTAEMSETLRSLGSRDLVFGNPWGQKSFEGTLSDFEIRIGDSGNQATDLLRANEGLVDYSTISEDTWPVETVDSFAAADTSDNHEKILQVGEDLYLFVDAEGGASWLRMDEGHELNQLGGGLATTDMMISHPDGGDTESVGIVGVADAMPFA